MNITQRKKAINQLVYSFAETLGYEVDHTDVDVVFVSSEGHYSDDDISYRRSSNDVCCLNWASDITHRNVKKIEEYIDYLHDISDDNMMVLIG